MLLSDRVLKIVPFTDLQFSGHKFGEDSEQKWEHISSTEMGELILASSFEIIFEKPYILWLGLEKFFKISEDFSQIFGKFSSNPVMLSRISIIDPDSSRS